MHEGRTGAAREYGAPLRAGRSGLSIFSAALGDIPEIIALGHDFYDEADFGGLGYDPVKAAESMGYLVGLPTGEVLVAREEHGAMAGFLAFDVTRHYTVELMACMFLFYVHPDARRTLAARELLEVALEVSRGFGAKAFFASSTAGISAGTDSRLRNLYAKYGFRDLGCFMRVDL